MFAIPVSVIGTFVIISFFGLSINVISLAGLAFAVGMVVDASIVSQENIYRLNQSGMSAENASINGVLQVWKPILGSALTTVIVFIPILMVDLPVGQLFRDIAVAISVFSAYIGRDIINSYTDNSLNISLRHKNKNIAFKILILDDFARIINNLILKYIKWSLKSITRGLS